MQAVGVGKIGDFCPQLKVQHFESQGNGYWKIIFK
jgi:hypothetical protein